MFEKSPPEDYVFRNKQTWDTLRKELSNVPRYDIDGRRYGNTLSDDMFSIKNSPLRENRHAPETYDYFTQPGYEEIQDPQYPGPNFVTQQHYDYKNPGFISRKKFITEGESIPEADHEWSAFDGGGEWEELIGAYQDALNEKRMEDLYRTDSTGSSILDDTRYIKTNGRTMHLPGTQIHRGRTGAEYDPDTGLLVNYNRLSPRVLKILAESGVQRAENGDLNWRIRMAREYYNSLKERANAGG